MEYTDDMDFIDDKKALKRLLPITTEILQNVNLFTNEDKTSSFVYMSRTYTTWLNADIP